MSRQAECMAYVSLIGLELVHIALIVLGVYLYTKEKNLAGAYLIGVFVFTFLLFNCLVCCYKDKIKVAIAIIDAAADYYAATKRLFFVSIFYFMLHIVLFGLMVASVFFFLGT